MTWRNRIKERTTVKADSLIDNEGNWRTHPEAQKAGMVGVLDEVGIVDALTVYYSEARGGMVIIDGHLRKSIDPDQEWPVDVLDVDDAEADYILATKDPLAAAAVANREKLGALLAEVQSGEAGVQALLGELAEREGVYFGGNGYDYSDFNQQLDALEGFEEINISITIPAKFEGQVVEWLANGEAKTAPGMGKGVLRHCGLL